jgi:uncharacterized protein with WD repeat
MKREAKELLNLVIDYETSYNKYLNGRETWNKDISTFRTLCLFNLETQYFIVEKTKFGEDKVYVCDIKKEAIETMLKIISENFVNGVLDNISKSTIYTIMTFRTNYVKGNFRISLPEEEREVIVTNVIERLFN